MAINSSLTSLFNDVKPMNDPTIEANVEMEPSKLMFRLAKEILSEMKRLMPYMGYEDVSSLEVEDIYKYLCSLVWMRCQYVSQSDSKAYRPYRNRYGHLAVPVVLSQMLLAIGLAYDNDFSIQFTPVYTIKEDCLLSAPEMEAISDVMRRMEMQGLKLVFGLPKDQNGDLDFMALCHVEGTVKGYRRSHPVYGFLASFFEQKKFNEITGLMCRVLYGYDSDYEMYVSRFFYAIRTAPVTHVKDDGGGVDVTT